MNYTARLALAAMLFAVPAQAQDRDARAGIVIDTNLFCDTQDQIKSFVTHFNGNNGNAEAAIDAVNAEESSADACVIATVAYRRGQDVGTVRSDETTLHVVQIEVVGVFTGSGFEEAQPTAFFTLLPDDEMPAAETVGRR
jgi:hypothetical protein